jgi:acyl-coenzyme A synthetase/AMP-(fatty) acid ligase
MGDWPNRPFLVGRDGSVALTYAGLGTRLAAREHRPVLRTTSAAEALAALVVAMVRQAPLRLVDGDFSSVELAKLGVTESELDATAVLPGAAPGSLAEAQALSREGSGFALSLYTSGSTGLPKLVTHRRETLARTLREGPRHANDIWALAYNPTHIAGIQVALQAFANGNTLIDVFGLGRADVLGQLARWAVTHVSATPTFYRLLLPVESPLGSLHSLTLGGERSDGELLDRLRAAFPGARLHNLYASTEAGTLLVADGELFGIHPAVEGKVRIEDGQILVGRQLLATFEGRVVEGDWYPTGDRVEVVTESPLRFRILGRSGDFINVGGAKVDPAEVEDALRAFPGVTEARAYGRANSVVGTLLCADYTSDAPLAEPDLRAHLGARLQPHKVPRLIKRVDALAKTRTGKLSRHA